MSERDEHQDPGTPREPTSPEAARALEAVRALPRPTAPAAVRQRARSAFVEGPAGDASGNVVALSSRRRRMWVPLAVAASVLLFLAGYGSRTALDWRLEAVNDPDGDLRGNTARVVGATLDPGFVETPEHGEFEMSLGDALRLRMAPCSGVFLPPPPRRWLPQPMQLVVQRGEVYGSTAGGELAVAFDIRTPQASARIAGTTFAVFLNDDGTCVCLLEGSVELRPTANPDETLQVPTGSKCYIYADGRPSVVMPIDDMERSKLTMIRDSAAGNAP